MGVLFTVAVDDPASPALFFLFELPPTALGFGLYGGVTVAVVLGVPLLFVVAVSTFVDDVDAVGRDDVESSTRDDVGTGDSATGDVGADDSGAGRSTESPKD